MATTTVSTRIEVRPMARADVRRVRDLQRRAYGPANPHTTFERELSNVSARYLVAVQPPEAAPHAIEAHGWLGRVRRFVRLDRPQREHIVGFAGGWAFEDQFHITTVAVDPSERRRGVATSLLLDIVNLACDLGLTTVALEVRVSNHGARRLYERFGLRDVGTLPAYYRDNDEDAIVMLSPALDDPSWRAAIASLSPLD